MPWLSAPFLIDTIYTAEEGNQVAKKKVNPRRIPLSKKAINKDAIIEEAMQDDMTQAWLLVASALVDRGYENISELSDAVNRFVETGSSQDAEIQNMQGKAARRLKEHRDSEMRRAREIIGILDMHLNPDMIKSPVELETFKRKVKRVALYTALSVIYLGLEATGQFEMEELKRIFLSADLTMAEIESGVNSFEQIERDLLNRMVKIELSKT